MTAFLHADLDGLLSASRNLSVLASRLPTLHTRAIGTLARRLPVQARRDIQAEYQIGARRITQDLSSRATDEGETWVAVTGLAEGDRVLRAAAGALRAGTRVRLAAGAAS